MWFEDKLISVWSSLYYVANNDEDIKRFVQDPDSAMLCVSSYLHNGYKIGEDLNNLAYNRYNVGSECIFRLDDLEKAGKIIAYVSSTASLRDYYIVLMWDRNGQHLKEWENG